MSDLSSNREYRRRRGYAVLSLLRQLWGNGSPPGQHPELTVLIDAVALDDDLGREEGLVVHGDRLTYRALGLLLGDGQTPGLGSELLSVDLMNRAVRAAPAVTTASDITSLPGVPSGDDGAGLGGDVFGVPSQRRSLQAVTTWIDLRSPTAPPGLKVEPEPGVATDESGAGSKLVGAWYLNVDEQTLSWDLAGARLLGREGFPRHSSVPQELAAIHPEDRASLADGLQRCIRSADPHHARFRARTAGGGFVACVGTGRQIVDAHGKTHLVGFLHSDQWFPAGAH